MKPFRLRQLRLRNYLAFSLLILADSYPMSSISRPTSATGLHAIFTIAFCQMDCDTIRKNLPGEDSVDRTNGRKGLTQTDPPALC
jgi:hypothetical protein